MYMDLHLTCPSVLPLLTALANLLSFLWVLESATRPQSLQSITVRNLSTLTRRAHAIAQGDLEVARHAQNLLEAKHSTTAGALASLEARLAEVEASAAARGDHAKHIHDTLRKELLEARHTAAAGASSAVHSSGTEGASCWHHVPT